MMEKFGFGASRRKNITLIVLKYGGECGCFSWFGLRIDGRVDSTKYIEEIPDYHVFPFLKNFEKENGPTR
ncbi:uncharacterized protein OCT59_004747 [Rhizophagus irregularis]|uniref:uncharacterized protein n=1 Tax=Rhizophagus irregularis TaxID=588596 RepID=UPI00331C6D0B|nr:hypothetical protein OCT59_004747 [Rhizophagus irregularis]